jgi:fatty acid amide hydrolase 2
MAHRFLKPFDFVDCAIVNAMELPATAVPMGLNAGGIPTGIQVVANQNNDHLSLLARCLRKSSRGLGCAVAFMVSRFTQ